MSDKRKQNNTVDAAWNKEVKRLKQFLNRSEKRGFTYPDFVIPSKPQNLTLNAVKQLQKITPQSLYQQAEYTDPQSGRSMSGIEGRALERHRASKKAAQTLATKQGRVINTKRASAEPYETNNQLWNREIKRIDSLMRNASKRGFTFSGNIIPGKPPHITKSDIASLKEINGQTIYTKAKYHDPVTGDTMSGVEGRKLERSRAALKGAKHKKDKPDISQPRETFYSDRDDLGDGEPPTQSYEILRHIREEIDRWTPESGWSQWLTNAKQSDRNILSRILDGAIEQEGEQVVAARLEANAMEVQELVQQILYGSGRADGSGGKVDRNVINFDLVRFSSIIMGRVLSVNESQELTDLAENLEVDQ